MDEKQIKKPILKTQKNTKLETVDPLLRDRIMNRNLGCVYCQNIDLKKMHILEPEGEPEMRLDVCDECHTYLKTYNEEGAEDVYLRDWATIHLDLLGEEQGLRKKGSVLLASE